MNDILQKAWFGHAMQMSSKGCACISSFCVPYLYQLTIKRLRRQRLQVYEHAQIPAKHEQIYNSEDEEALDALPNLFAKSHLSARVSIQGSHKDLIAHSFRVV